ncbi:MAG: acyloxyacyl hydrolase [Pseudoflavonifractor sp.]|nr:acyloxyacyl hydrolase [Alloprevotella sp.]MCM1117231.1 acyloxyacyl hydrolase [Pseudoflavonifractor sp.]
MNRLTAFLLTSIIALNLIAQRPGQYVEADIAPGYTLPTSAYFRGDNPQGHHFGPMLQGSARWGIASSRGIKMGIGLKAMTFLRPSLIGSPAGIFIYQGANLTSISRRLTLVYEWQFGATAPWQINGPSHPDNMVNGSPVCALLGASLLLRYNLNSDWTLIGGLDLAHYSNGNTRWPNAGTNTAALRLGISRHIGSAERVIKMIDGLDTLERPRRAWDILLWGAWHKKCYHDENDEAHPYPGVFGAAGINISPMWRAGKRFRVGPSLDLIWDEAAIPASYMIGEEGSSEQPYFIRPPFIRQTAAGISVGGEYEMPIFSLHISMGYNVIAGCKDLRYFYQTLALRTWMTRNLWVNVGYSLRDFAHPRHLMLGLGLRL